MSLVSNATLDAIRMRFRTRKPDVLSSACVASGAALSPDSLSGWKNGLKRVQIKLPDQESRISGQLSGKPYEIGESAALAVAVCNSQLDLVCIRAIKRSETCVSELGNAKFRNAIESGVRNRQFRCGPRPHFCFRPPVEAEVPQDSCRSAVGGRGERISC